MVLLRGAERTRRLVLACTLVALLALQSLRPVEWVEEAVEGPLSGPLALLTNLASAVASSVTAEPQPEGRAAPSMTLVEVERASGQPAPVAGLAWLEVPVLEVSPTRDTLRLGAGEDLHLVAGMAVAFGDVYLGRLAEVAATTSVVELVEGANVRTGILVRAAPQLPGFPAVALGRRGGAAPLMKLSASGARPRVGDEVLWRVRDDDPRSLAAAGLRLGVLAREGDEGRGSAVWIVDPTRPAGAEGRVFIAAGAVGDRLIAERTLRTTGARRLLPADAVLGRGWPALTLDEALPGAVVRSGPRVAGEVAVLRGRVAWLRRRAPREWAGRALRVAGDPPQVMPQEPGEDDAAPAQLYSRGGGTVPRGLWLGTVEDEPAGLADPLTAAILAPTSGR